MKSLADYIIVVMPDDDRWLAYVPAIPGCHAAGSSSEEAREELDDVFEMFRDDFDESGEEWPADVRELIPVAG